MGSESSWSHATGMVQDWYALLKVDAGSDDQTLDDAIERLSRQASVLANTSPERSQQIRENLRAIKRDLRSGPEARLRYNEKLSGYRQDTVSAAAATRSPSEPQAAGQGTNSPQAPSIVDAVVANLAPVASRFRRFLQTGWRCPACGSDGGPGDQFCMKCGAAMKSDNVVRKTMCSTCKATLAPGDRFCGRCGTAVT
jgi:Double zinc ribbon